VFARRATPRVRAREQIHIFLVKSNGSNMVQIDFAKKLGLATFRV
jgi:hypothetical protein